ncbi:MAG: PrgI family protein [Anaerofustis sp.]
MAYVPVPKDLTKIKTKVMFNLTKRQLICFSLAAVAGIPLFFLLKAHTSVSAAALMMVLSMLPFFMFALYEKNGQPLEVLLRHIIQARFARPKQRLYRTNNFYAVLERQTQLDKEVKAIVTGKEKACRARKA